MQNVLTNALALMLRPICPDGIVCSPKLLSGGTRLTVQWQVAGAPTVKVDVPPPAGIDDDVGLIVAAAQESPTTELPTLDDGEEALPPQPATQHGSQHTNTTAQESRHCFVTGINNVLKDLSRSSTDFWLRLHPMT